ncbi:TonB-dependent receptor [Mucilaginibacter limnophilus]|uniref:TonB-dependent receptor n=1 Tax=Mucilaginibacter limnophilus TaxID=1932778 RepID=A0A3S2Y5W8_9SPHI|nr:TonB-dependent receptor [Mucilaginibacter limnophilus]RVU02833.1 TonB-dependent receptor [Mucilaginibacter limnophilus]
MNQNFKLKTFPIERKPHDPKKAFFWIAVLLLGLLAPAANAQVPKITVTGTVTDSVGEKLIGVNIAVENKSGVGTTTDVNGKFVLDVEEGSVLRITYVGFTDQRITVNANNRTLNIVLHAAGKLEEVVVVAYGRKQTREAIVGSVSSVKPSDLKIPASNLTNALAGKVAGVIAFQPSGQPGVDNANFFIRGVTTFGYRREPLILVDNVEVSTNDFARLQVDDIESFSILKDASAVALYGARGGNGVIIVKTKEGKIGKAQIAVRLETASSESGKNLEFADPITYMRLFNEATVTRYSGRDRPYTDNDILNTQATINGAPGSNPYVYPAVDWMGLLFKSRTSTQRANINVSGGSGAARYYVAGSFSNDNGLLRSDIRNNNNNNVNFKNYQLRTNVNINLTKNTELVVRLSGNFNEYNGPQTNDASFATDLYNLVTHTSPVDFPAYYEPDVANLQTKHVLFGNVAKPNTKLTEFVNPYAALLKGHKNFSESKMLAQFELNQGLEFLTKGLNAHAIFSTNRYARFESKMEYLPYYYEVESYDRLSNTYTLDWINDQPKQAQEYLNYTAGDDNLNTFYYGQASIDYNRDFGNHNISSALIGTMQQTVYANASALINALPFRNLTLAGRATYSYKRKYYLEFNFGYNGSERFSENHRFGFFPTIGGSWIISDEKFWGNLSSVLERVKLRASYGLAGNDAISDRRFYYLSDVNLNGGNPAVFGTNNGYSLNGVSINNYENRNVTWELSRQTNLGLEISFLKDFKLIAEVYKNDKSDILQARSDIPSTMGLEAAISANIGKVSSKGFELSLDGRRDLGNTLWIGALGNFTYAQNKFTQYEEPEYKESYRYHVGQPVNHLYGYVAERLFVDDEEARNSPQQIFSGNGIAPMGGDIKYRDLNNDGIINGDDQTYIGNPSIPQIVYGFGVSSGFKNFDLSAFFQGQAKVSFLIDAARTSPFIKSPDDYFNTGNTQLLQAYADDHWSEDNQNLYALYPRLGPDGAVIENNRQASTWWLRDGSFLRLKSLQVGYTLPRNLSAKLKLKTLRIYFNGLNLVTWSPFKMWDPELGGNGFAYPIQKVYNLGLDIKL